MKNFLPCILLSFAMLPVLSFAQTGKFEDELLTSQQVASERYILNNSVQTNVPKDVANAAIISQKGNNNTFDGKQQAGTGGNANIISVMQSGNLNTATLEQTGAGNKTAINQTGYGNDYEGRIRGRNNASEIDQFGNNNAINQQLNGEGQQYRLIQQGNNNQINQYENGAQHKGYEVIQQGSGMNITITNGY